ERNRPKVQHINYGDSTQNHDEYWNQYDEAAEFLLRHYRRRLHERNNDPDHTEALMELKTIYAACLAAAALRWYSVRIEQGKNRSNEDKKLHQDIIKRLVTMATAIRLILPQDLTQASSIYEVYKARFENFKWSPAVKSVDNDKE
ncbi:unnamed protein product, partial [Rotaria sp. Silwood1]